MSKGPGMNKMREIGVWNKLEEKPSSVTAIQKCSKKALVMWFSELDASLHRDSYLQQFFSRTSLFHIHLKTAVQKVSEDS